MKCTEFENLIDEYVDNELTHSTELVEEHIKNCESCRALYEETLELKEMLSGLEMIDLPEDFEASLHEKLLVASKDNVRPLRRYNKQIKWIGSIAALAIVSVSVYNALPNGGNDVMDVNIASMEMTEESYASDDMAVSDEAEFEMAEEAAPEAMAADAVGNGIVATYSDTQAKSIRMGRALPVASGRTYYIDGDRVKIESFIQEWDIEELEFFSYQYQFYIQTDQLASLESSLKESFSVTDEVNFDYQAMLEETTMLHREQVDTVRYLEQKLKDAKEEDKEALKFQLDSEKDLLMSFEMDLEDINYYKNYQQIIIIMNEE